MKTSIPSPLVVFTNAFLLLGYAGMTATPAIKLEVGDATPATGGPAVTLGWSFTVETPITVTSLGIFDADENGLDQSHPVTIWNTTSGQLTVMLSATIPAGSSGTVVDGTRYVSVPNTVLPTGEYVIGAFYGNQNHDAVHYNVESVTTDPSITYVGGRFFVGPTLSFPDGPGVGNGIFGPNFQLLSESPAAIISQPVSVLAYAGSNVVFKVSAVGAAPLSYQWRHNGTPLLGAQGPSLTLTNVSLHDVGTYDVIVSNQFGSPVTSDQAVLEVSSIRTAMFTGIIVTGSPGDLFRIDYTEDLIHPNWVELARVTLTETTATWIDLDSPSQQHRFYRGVLLND